MQPRRIALLALLAAHPHHTLGREKLIAFLWPESDEAQGRHRLSESLYVLRKDLGERNLVSEGDQIRMDLDRMDCDVVSFRRSLEAGDWEGAVALYAGPFLDGFFLNEADDFQRWVESERRSLAEDFGRALQALASAAEAEGDPLKAVEWWTRLTTHDPFNSRLALGLMNALAEAGDPGNAIHHAREHIHRLRDDLGAEAPVEILTFIEDARNGDAQVSARGRAGVTLPERDRATGPRIFPDPDTEVDPRPFGTSPRGPTRLRRSWAIPGSMLATVLAMGAVFAFLRPHPPPDLVPDLVVVPPFENLTNDPELDEVCLDAATWVEEAILQVEGVQVVPGTFARDYAEQATLAGSANPVWAAAQRSRAGWAVGGRIQLVGDSLEVRADIIDLSHPRKTQGVVESGGKERLNEILDRLARRVSGALAYEFDPWMGEMEPGSQPLPIPPTIDAFREHRLGFEAFDRQDWAASFQHHLEAFALDTTLVHAVVSAAYVADNDRVKDSLAVFANKRRHLLSSQGKRDLDLLLAIRASDWEEALRLIRETSYLEEGGYSSVLEAWFAMRVNLPEAAFESTKRYDPDLEWRRGEAHLFFRYRTEALHMLGRFNEELTEAGLGRKRYPNNLELLIAEARGLVALGRVGDVKDCLHLARALALPYDSVAVVTGMELRAHGHLAASKEVFDQAVARLTPEPDGEVLDAKGSRNLARALYGAERWEDAQEAAMGILAESPEDLSALGLLGLAGARMGDSSLATEVMDRLSGVSRPETPGEPRYLMASIAAVLGHSEEAMRFLYQAYAEGMPHSLRLHRDMNLESLREREDFRALLAPRG